MQAQIGYSKDLQHPRSVSRGVALLHCPVIAGCKSEIEEKVKQGNERGQLDNPVARISSGQPISDPTSLDKMLFDEGRASFRTKSISSQGVQTQLTGPNMKSLVPCYVDASGIRIADP